MKKIFTLFAIVGVTGATAQTLVGTAVTKRKAILEEFTGVRCPNCPDGHTIANTILSTYPGQAIVLAYHPVNSSYTTPVNGTDPDFRRAYLDNFYSTAYVGSRFMPSAMINRRKWGSPAEKRATSRGDWTSYVGTVMAENSPMNVGLSSSHNSTTNELTINVEVYYTSSVLDSLTLYVHLIEDNLVAEQQGTGGSPTYVHKRTFRENINSGIWGDGMTGTTTAGSLNTAQYVFDLDNATDPVNVSNAQVVAFVYNNTTGEVETGNAVAASGGSTVGVEENVTVKHVGVYPNPAHGQFILEVLGNGQQQYGVEIMNLAGQTVYNESITASGNGAAYKTISTADMASGMYVVKVSYANGTTTTKLVVE